MPHLREIPVVTPTADSIALRYGDLEIQMARCRAPEEAAAALKAWDDYRRELATWESMVDLRFNQDTRNADYRRDRELLNELRPKFTEGDVRLKRLVLNSPWRAVLEQTYGPQIVALWQADLKSFDPALEPKLVEEAKLESAYTEVTAAARVQFRGESHNLSSIVKYREHPDRATRFEAEQTRWQWFADHRAELDRIFHEQVQLRTAMARELGYANFIDLGYARMKRVDYTQQDVERFRAAVRADLVPLCDELRKEQAARLGIEKVRFWDEALHDLQGNPAPQGDHDWLIDQAQVMFDQMKIGLGECFRLMRESDLIDLKNREGKAPGGFCTSFPTVGLPFIYANFNGTKHDVEVFTHEMGHAFQNYESRQQPLIDYLWPTYESCEIHSMGLEFLTWPYMNLFFGEDAERFRRTHLTQALLFIPYGVAVDHFQHLVYAQPEATPEERHAMWQEVERLYLPTRDYGDLPHVNRGGLWQFQRHIFLSPFYYIDYTLAQTCALQLWVESQRDTESTLRTYHKLCEVGGSLPFQELVKQAHLQSPFKPGCLAEVVKLARDKLAAG